MANILVLGAGVSGLTTALQLARSEPRYSITIIAKHMPGDYDIEYASPWAGANFTPNLAAKQGRKATADSAALVERNAAQEAEETSTAFERQTWSEIERLARDVPEAGIHFQQARSLRRAKDAPSGSPERLAKLAAKDEFAESYMPNWRKLSPSELPPSYVDGTAYTTVCINTALYLPWLASQCLKLGVHLRRGIVTHISEAAHLHHSGKNADLVVNCTGLSSLYLGGVEDSNLYPGRGQLVLVRNETPYNYGSSGTDDGPAESMYTMTRAAGGGCVLGGSMHHSWESQPDPNLAVRIMKRAVDVAPELVSEGAGIEGLSIVRHAVGLRPMRKGGMRVEKEMIGGLPVVHNYGHGGYGYQTSYGASEAVRRLVVESLQQRARL